MVIITKGAIHGFAKKYANAAMVLNEWFDKTKKAKWSKLSDFQLTFNSIEAIGNDRYIFNIGGDNFRIVAMIHFNIRTVYIRAILTHPQYDALTKINKLTTL